jgi:hypothetical protein
MTPEEHTELIIRIDENVKNINDKLSKLQCSECITTLATHSEKLKTHDKIIWGSIMASVSAISGTVLIGIRLFMKKII